jgi:hypothetical protein
MGTLFADQVFDALLSAQGLTAGLNTIQTLPAPGSISRRPAHSYDEKPYVLLPASAARELTWHGTWRPTAADIDGLESSLPMVPFLKVGNWPESFNMRIDHPEQYFRQYVAVVRKGKKLIYVNAFCDAFHEEIPTWRQHLVVILDGGKCCWQALYDPTGHIFLALSINGVA